MLNVLVYRTVKDMNMFTEKQLTITHKCTNGATVISTKSTHLMM